MAANIKSGGILNIPPENLNLFYKITFITFLVLSSCTKEVKINFPKSEPSPVMNCFFCPDSIFRLKISHTRDILSTNQPITSYDDIQLFENEIPVGKFSFIKDGIYEIPVFKPKTRNKYRIEFETGNNTIFTADSIPPYPKLLHVDFVDSVRINEYGRYILNANIRIKDNPDIHNFYEIRFKGLYLDKGSNETKRCGVTIEHSIIDPIILNENIMDYYPEELIFSDELVDGTSFTINISYSLRNGKQPGEGLIVELRAISESYYKFKKSILQHVATQDADIWDNYGEPVQMYSNIKGGYGIFAAFTSVIDTVYKND